MSWNKKFRFLFTTILVSILVSSVAACGAPIAPNTEITTIRYGGQLYPEDYLLKGEPKFWTDQGITVEHVLYSSGTENSQALISGNADIISGSDSKVVALFGAIPDQALIIGVAQRGDRYSTIVAGDSNFTTWYELKGKKIAIRLGTGAEQVVRRYFEIAGDLKWEDFQWVNMKVEDMGAALADKSIDAFTAWEPTPAIAEAKGIGRVMLSYGDVALTPVLYVTTRKYAETHRAEIIRFLAAQLQKADLIKNDPITAARIAAGAASSSGSDVSPDTFEKIFRRVDFSITLDDAVLSSIDDTAAFLLGIGEIDAIPVIKSDSSFLEEAQKLVNRK
jgi:NitT/TauT family transport system substrate-binding protein